MERPPMTPMLTDKKDIFTSSLGVIRVIRDRPASPCLPVSVVNQGCVAGVVAGEVAAVGFSTTWPMR
jgi:hypothetical protein